MLKALSEKNRLRTVYVLHQAKTSLCVCELVDILQESQYNVSRYVKTLKDAGLLYEKKQGKWVYYGISASQDEKIKSIKKLISELDANEFPGELLRMKKRLDIREKGVCVIGLIQVL
jgi:ArsR family transcriptional regulator